MMRRKLKANIKRNSQCVKCCFWWGSITSGRDAFVAQTGVTETQSVPTLAVLGQTVESASTAATIGLLDY